MNARQRKMRLQSVDQWMCSVVCQSACRCSGLALLVHLSDVWLLGLEFCSPRVFAVGLRIFDLRTLGSGHSKSASRRMQIHLIWRTGHFRGGVFVSLCFRNWFCCTEAANDDTRIVFCYCGIPPRNLSVISECLRNVPHISQLPD